MKQNTKRTLLLAVLALCHGVLPLLMAVPKAQAANAITFPVIGNATFVNDYYAPRGSGIHEAIDVMASKGQKLVAVVDGTIRRVNYPQPSWGYAIYIEDVHGYEYGYLHMNDDNPGTNDGQGGGMHAYAPDMERGNKVKKGQHIGWVGDSGNSNGVSHLHFEMYEPDGDVVNPYDSLRLAPRLSKPLLYPALEGEILPYGRSYKGGVDIEMGNFDGDMGSEFIAGSGQSMQTSVTVYNDDDTYIRRFNVFASSFGGGVHVGTADVDGDGTDEILAAAGNGGMPLVKIYEPDGTEVGRFYAYDSSNKMGVLVAGGDIDGDGTDEIITSLSGGGVPRIKVFTPDGVMQSSFYAYGETTRFGTDIAAGNVTGSIADEIITAPQKGAVPKVKMFNGNGSFVRQFYAYGQGFLGGVRVSVGDVLSGNPDEEIATIPASGTRQSVKLFSGESIAYLESDQFLEEWWIGYHDISAGDGGTKTATFGNRRVSIRDGID